MSNPREARVVLNNVTTQTGDNVLHALQQRWLRGGTVRRIYNIRAEDHDLLTAGERQIAIEGKCAPSDGEEGCFAAQCGKVISNYPMSVPSSRISHCSLCPRNTE